jgi:hypothetical protein
LFVAFSVNFGILPYRALPEVTWRIFHLAAYQRALKFDLVFALRKRHDGENSGWMAGLKVLVVVSSAYREKESGCQIGKSSRLRCFPQIAALLDFERSKAKDTPAQI